MKPGRLIWLLALHALSGAVFAQADLLVTNAPFAPADAAEKSGTAFAREIACFRCAASSGSVDVIGFQLTPGGTGDWVNDLDATNGVEVWLDDGDSAFGAATDTLLGFAAGAAAPFSITFTPAATIASGASADFWVVLNFLASAGNSIPDTFTVSLAAPADVTTSVAANITFGVPAPTGSSFSVVDFFVTLVVPTSHPTGYPISFDGSGFMVPITVMIGGAQCTGTPLINAAGTQVMGLFVPPPLVPGDLGPHAIVITSGLLAPQTLTQSFRYEGSGGYDCGECCSSGETQDLGVLAVLAAALSLLGLSRVIRTRA